MEMGLNKSVHKKLLKKIHIGSAGMWSFFYDLKVHVNNLIYDSYNKEKNKSKIRWK